ncbi:delta-60 repeat domain-containing protein [Pseudomonas sp. FP2196]|uniref:delta-60 repeat domain-containing protein n=1 Tax=Pseudomonas sp. FP2196 TaxID=2954086 RepID=UPI00273583CA|nr:delta-60 repeat domain-containing protein [Pseudomonas sp. FP2196]WLH38189.1 delta-60 repeat domain-containing protein [Pseudomonas sp. FP2196]
MSTLNAVAQPLFSNDAGQLDKTFAVNGAAQVYFAGSLSSLTQDVALDAQGRILVAAKVGGAAGSRFGLARLLADGSADLSFGQQGSVIDTFAHGFEAMASKVRVLPDGRILLAGLHYENSHRTLPALALFDAQGNPEQIFGDNGRQVVRLPGDLSMGTRDTWLPPGVPGAEACDVAVQDDGHILLIANHHFELADHAGILIRLRPDGGVDETFNGRGFVMIRHLLLNTWLNSLLLQEDGRIVVAGSIDFPQQGLLARYLPDGRLDERFAVDGFMAFTAHGQSAQVSQVLESTGSLHCFGSSRDPIRCVAFSLHPNGRPDLHRNNGQPQLLEIGPSGCQWSAGQRMADGRMIAVGATIGGIEADFIVARYCANGLLDPSFGQGFGWQRTRLGRSLDTANSLALQTDGAIVVGGYSLDGNYRAMVVRYLNS